MRKSISVAFFSLVSTLMVLGIVLMGASEWVLFKNYFAKDRYETLDQVVGVTQRTAATGGQGQTGQQYNRHFFKSHGGFRSRNSAASILAPPPNTNSPIKNTG